MTPMTPARYWWLQMLLEWALTCKCRRAHVVSVAFIPLIVCVSVSRSIKRIIFNTLIKPNINDKGEKHMETISTSQALQIAGRAGRCVPFLLSVVSSVQERFSHVCILRGNVLTQSSVFPRTGSPPSLKREKLPPCTGTICPS